MRTGGEDIANWGWNSLSELSGWFTPFITASRRNLRPCRTFSSFRCVFPYSRPTDPGGRPKKKSGLIQLANLVRYRQQRNLNNVFAYDLVPSASVMTAALRAARRVNDFPTAVRIFEGETAPSFRVCLHRNMVPWICLHTKTCLGYPCYTAFLTCRGDYVANVIAGNCS